MKAKKSKQTTKKPPMPPKMEGKGMEGQGTAKMMMKFGGTSGKKKG